MENNIAETKNLSEQKPASVPSEVKEVKTEEVKKTEAKAEVKADAKPAVDEAEKKRIAAFVKLRQQNRELKQKLESMKSNSVSTSTQEVSKIVETKPAEQQEQTQKQAEPSQPKTNDEFEVLERTAIENLAKDADIMKIPGAVIDILDMVDSDVRLARLYHIDPELAIREAKNIWKEKVGLSPNKQVQTPIPSTPKGGFSIGEGDDLKTLLSKLDKAIPGTKEFNALVDKLNEIYRQINRR
jgi:hypothetical protein